MPPELKYGNEVQAQYILYPFVTYLLKLRPHRA